MGDLLVLGEADVRRGLDVDDLRAEVASALRDLSEGAASAPARVGAMTGSGLLGAMPAFLPARGLVAKLVSVFPGNGAHGLPSHQALIAMFDPETGVPLAIMDGRYITAVRTAAASAVAVEQLARSDAAVLAVLGAGVQGRAHLDAVTRVHDFAEIRVASRSAAHALDLADHHPQAVVASSFEAAVRGADVVCCCTNAPEPVVEHGWLRTGVHVGSVGTGTELDDATVRAATVFVEWRGAASEPPPAGAAELQGVDPAIVTELGEVLVGTKPGRRSSDEITVYKSTGHAVEDAAAAALAYLRATELGLGTRVALSR